MPSCQPLTARVVFLSMGAEVVLLGVWVEGGQGACFPGDDREGANIFLPFFLGLGLFHGLNIKVKE